MLKRKSLLVLISSGALLAAALAASPAQAQSPSCVGAPGVGDPDYPNYGNGGYDVAHYGLKVDYKPATDQLQGKAKIRAKATQRLCTFNLDLVGLSVHKVKVNGKETDFSRSGQELIIEPDRSLKDGKAFKVAVRYSGIPSEFTIPGTTIRTGFMATPEGATVAGQPEVAAGWFPVNDHPIDKASYAFDVTVPNAYEVAANGFLQGTKRNKGEGTSTWKWRADEPMASYLATIDIGQWDVTETTHAGFPSYDAIASQITGGLRQEIDDSMSKQGEIIGMLEDAFGPYPFSTVGGIVPNQNDFGFALETQTRPVYTKRFWLNSQGQPRDADWVVVHEYAHQWFGDDVALAKWHDIWLNEGPATYAEWIWEEHLGNATPQEIFQATYDAIPADDPFWDVVIGDPGVDFLFHDAVYVRGGMTLQALRNEIGDDAFFELLQTWTDTHSGGHGTTLEFMALAEQISGQQLDALFNLWLFTGEKPPPEAVEPPAAAERSAAATSSDASWVDEMHERLASGRY
jgi:aminopeptidase N